MRPGRYDARAHDAWVGRLGHLHAPLGPTGVHHLVGRRLAAAWPIGCYVGVDRDERVRYVGKVCRDVGGFAERFVGHHQPVEEWDRVWLLPLRQAVPPHIVGAIEALLIRVLFPKDNVVWPRVSIVRRDRWAPDAP